MGRWFRDDGNGEELVVALALFVFGFVVGLVLGGFLHG